MGGGACDSCQNRKKYIVYINQLVYTISVLHVLLMI